jgi:hypothetical protein
VDRVSKSVSPRAPSAAVRSYIATVAFVAQSLSFELPFVARLGTLAETAGTIIWFSWTVPMLLYDYARALSDDRPSGLARAVERGGRVEVRGVVAMARVRGRSDEQWTG